MTQWEGGNPSLCRCLLFDAMERGYLLLLLLSPISMREGAPPCVSFQCKLPFLLALFFLFTDEDSLSFLLVCGITFYVYHILM